MASETLPPARTKLTHAHVYVMYITYEVTHAKSKFTHAKSKLTYADLLRYVASQLWLQSKQVNGKKKVDACREKSVDVCREEANAR